MDDTKEYILRVAETIALQIGGHKFEEETGSKFDFCSFNKNGDPFLAIQLAKNSKGWKKLYIVYDRCMDSYNMIFVDKDDHSKIKENIYCDQLQDMFSRYTGIKIEKSRVDFG